MKKSRILGILVLLLFTTLLSSTCRSDEVREEYVYTASSYSSSALHELTISFSDSIIDISDIDTMTNQIAGYLSVSVSPEVPGHFRPVGSDSCAFVFDEDLTLSERYIVYLNTENLPDGVTVKVNYQDLNSGYFAFDTTRIKVSSVSRADKYLDTPVYIKFNQPVELSEINSKVTVSSGFGNYVDFSSSYKITTNTSTSNGVLIHTVTTNLKTVRLNFEDLQPDKTYTVTVPKGFLGAQGSLGTKSKYTKSFSTYSPQSYEKFLSSDYSYADHKYHFYPDSTVKFEFENTFDVSVELSNLITVSPEVEGLEFSYSGSYVKVEGNFIGGTQYSFMIQPGLTDIYGQVYESVITETETFEHSISYFNMPDGYLVMENYLDNLLPMKTKNNSAIQFDYSFVDNLSDVVEYLNPKGSFNVSSFEDDLATEVFDLDWEWDTVKNLSLDLSEYMTGESGVLFYHADPTQENPEKSTTDKSEWGMILFTDMGVTVKQAPQTTLIIVRTLKDNEPVAGAQVYRVNFNDDGAELEYIGVTDSGGFCETDTLPDAEDAAVYAAVSGSDFSFNYGSDSSYYFSTSKLEYYDYEDNVDSYYYTYYNYAANVIQSAWDWDVEEPELLVFSDRYLYSPGDTIHFKGMIRYRENDDWTTVPNYFQSGIEVSVSDPSYEQLTNLRVFPDDWGSFTFDIETDEDGATGYYRLTLDDAEGYWYHSVRVEEFEPAVAEFEITPLRDIFVWGEDFEADVIGQYLFGAPLQLSYSISATVSPAVYRSSKFHDYSFSSMWFTDDGDHRDYSFSLISDDFWPDEDGVVNLSEPLEKDDFYGDATVSLSATAQLDDGSTVYAIESDMDVYNPVHVGIKRESYFIDAGDSQKFDLIAIDEDEEITKGIEVLFELIKREWNSVQVAGVNGRLEWQSELVETVVYEKEYKVGEKTINVKIDDPGYYYARATANVRGQDILSETSFYATGSGNYGWEMSDDYDIELETDKESYDVGDIAQVLIQNPFETATAIVTVEREGIFDINEYEIEDSIFVIPVEIKDEFVPNAYVTVMLYSGRSGYGDLDEDGEDLSRPQYRFGYVNLDISTDTKRLNIDIETDKEEYEPGDTVTLTMDVKDFYGNSVESEITVSVADKGVLNLVSYEFPDPIETFYGNRYLAVYTSEMREFIFGERYLDEKGEVIGGDGFMDAYSDAGSIIPRQDFRSTAFFEDKVITTNGNRVTVTFTLPDNLTTFKIMAVAQTKNALFGKKSEEITVSLPLMVASGLPQFFRSGDIIDAGGVIYNYTGKDRDVAVTLTSEGGADFTTLSTNVFIENSGSEEVRFDFNVTGEDGDEFDFILSASAGGYSDAMSVEIPFYEPLNYETTGLFGSTLESLTENVNVTSAVVPELSSIEAMVSASAFSELKGALDYLLEYPYGCLEQKLSKILPLILAGDLLLQFDMFEDSSEEDMREAVQTVLDEVEDFEMANGFGYWTSSSYVSPYLTVYAAWILTMADEQGYTVDEDLLSEAVGWAEDYADDRGHYPSYWSYSDRYETLVRSFGLYVCGLNGMDKESALRRVLLKLELDDSTGSLSTYAFLLKAASKMGDDVLETAEEQILPIFLNQSRTEAEYIYFEPLYQWSSFYYTEMITSALILQALIEADSDFDKADKVVRYLLAAREADSWTSTHENALVFYALDTYFKKYENVVPDFNAEVSIDTESFLSAYFSDYQDPIQTGEYQLNENAFGNFEVSFDKAGEGRMYYYLRYKYILEEYPPYRDAGFFVEKKYYDYETDEEITDNIFVRGERYIVELTVTTPKARTFVVLDDRLPAGFEPVNLDFDTEESEDYFSTGLSYWSGFNHSEQYFDRVIFSADRLSAGTETVRYVVRAMICGEYEVPQVRAEEMYFPEVFGWAYPGKVTVIPEEE